MELYLRITELFLEAANVEEADRHTKRASLLQQDVKEESLILKYKVNSAFVNKQKHTHVIRGKGAPQVFFWGRVNAKPKTIFSEGNNCKPKKISLVRIFQKIQLKGLFSQRYIFWGGYLFLIFPDIFGLVAVQ